MTAAMPALRARTWDGPRGAHEPGGPGTVPAGLERLFAGSGTVLLPGGATLPVPGAGGVDLLCVAEGMLGTGTLAGGAGWVTGPAGMRLHGPGGLLMAHASAVGSATAPTVAALRPTRLLRVPAADLAGRLVGAPELMTRLLVLLDEQAVAELRWTSTTLRLALPGRVCAVLLRLSGGLAGGLAGGLPVGSPTGGQGRANRPGPWLELPQADLAAALGASRQSVNRVLQTLLERGLLERQGRSLRVVDPDGLRRRAGRAAAAEPARPLERALAPAIGL